MNSLLLIVVKLDLEVQVNSMSDTEVCPIAKAVAEEVLKRAEVGMSKYGVNADRNDLNIDDWLQHLKEELLDAAVYVTKLQKQLKVNPHNPAKPCPECHSSCILMGTLNTKVCSDCGWKDENWKREKDEPELYR